MLTDNAKVQAVLDQYIPASLQKFLEDNGTKIVVVNAGEKYIEKSNELSRLALDFDARPSPPAGMFIVAEKTLYLRSKSPMTIVHELGHAFDCALGNGSYHTGFSQRVRRFYRKAKSFVTPYASIGIDEYFAECFRAYFEANDKVSFWPRATKERLQRVDPSMFRYMEKAVTTLKIPPARKPRAKKT